MYPAKAHARRVVETYEKLFKTKVDFEVFVAGERARLWPYSDQEVKFRQNRYFNYITGAYDQRDCVAVYSPQNDKLVLYLPEVNEDDIMWSGPPLSTDDALALYDVDDVQYVTSLKFEQTKKVHSIEKSEDFPSVIPDPQLKDAFDEARVIKDEYEIGLMRRANQISDKCHLAVMSALPIETNETHLHAEFAYHALRQGAKEEAYDPICCSGTNNGTLHYLKNDESLDGRLNVLIDAGASHECYASDITRSFPINGVFSKESREIYDLVYKMQKETMTRIRPHVQWSDLHLLAHRILIDEFIRLGIFKKGSSPIEIYNSGISSAFYPHGLGHMIGMDTHDTAGHANYSDPDPKLRYLRIRRALEPGMVVTVEPGCYFNDFLLEGLGGDNLDFIDFEVLKKYKPVGGIRIEDDVLVTSTGFENLTGVASDPEEVQRIVQSGLRKGANAFHNLV